MILGVIPARMASTRFPGKPLATIGSRPMIWHVYQRCLEAKCLDRVVVATDDPPISSACRTLGMEWEEATTHRLDCLDCVADLATRVSADRYVIVQGDEPVVNPEAIRVMARTPYLPACGYADCEDPLDGPDSNVPKVVINDQGQAIYLSRLPVPYPKRRVLPLRFQVCVYAMDAEALGAFSGWRPGPVERQEGIGLLRFIENRHPVWMVEVPPSPLMVDTPADLERARTLMAGSMRAA